MASNLASSAPQHACWSTIVALNNADGSGLHRMATTLIEPNVAVRDVADAVHALGLLHGRQPGVLDHALARNSLPGSLHWLENALESFGEERAMLARLATAAGPLPSTPGQAESSAAVMAQRHALDMLAQSDRVGCAVGAAAALIIDWHAVRVVLDASAKRLGIEPMASSLPSLENTAAMIVATAQTGGIERAIAFGAQQVFAQHRGLWDLLEARASARAER